MSRKKKTPISRRESMRWGAAALSAAWVRPLAADISDQYAGLKSDEFLGAVRVLVRVEDDEVFLEGPAADGSRGVLFTNVPVSKILRWDPASEQLTVFRENTQRTNGLFFDRSGRLLACEGGAGRVTRHDLQSGAVEVLADSYRDRKLAAPNDVCVSAQGHIFFTSRSSVEDPPGENLKAVYRIDPDGTLHQVLAWPEVHMPNGIVISPDGGTLYLIEAHPDENHHRDLRAFDLSSDGSLANGRVVADLYPGRSGDGMCIDSRGNLYVAAGLHELRGTSETLATRPGIHVISPAGKLLAYRETPEDTITNCTFGGPQLKTLYVTCGSLLLSIPTTISGASFYR